MPRFYVPSIENEELELSELDSKHAIRVLRLKEGDDVITPYTFNEGASTIFYQKYQDFIDAISNISKT